MVPPLRRSHSPASRSPTRHPQGNLFADGSEATVWRFSSYFRLERDRVAALEVEGAAAPRTAPALREQHGPRVQLRARSIGSARCDGAADDVARVRRWSPGRQPTGGEKSTATPWLDQSRRGRRATLHFAFDPPLSMAQPDNGPPHGAFQDVRRSAARRCEDGAVATWPSMQGYWPFFR